MSEFPGSRRDSGAALDGAAFASFDPPLSAVHWMLLLFWFIVWIASLFLLWLSAPVFGAGVLVLILLGIVARSGIQSYERRVAFLIVVPLACVALVWAYVLGGIQLDQPLLDSPVLIVPDSP